MIDGLNGGPREDHVIKAFRDSFAKGGFQPRVSPTGFPFSRECGGAQIDAGVNARVV